MYTDDNHGTSGAPASTEAPAAGHNRPSLNYSAKVIREAFARAKGSSKATLNDLREVGDALNAAKDTLKDNGKGAFGDWCSAEGFPFDKSWRARLMLLDANWDAIQAAVEAIPEDKRKWSLDGVLGIWRAATKAEKAPAGGSEGGEGEGAAAEPKAKPETKAERLERLLQEALEKIAELQGEVDTLKGAKGAAKGSSKAKADAQPGTVDAATKARAKKVWGLFTKGATDGEKGAAQARLEDMAKKAGMALADFLKACGLEG